MSNASRRRSDLFRGIAKLALWMGVLFAFFLANSARAAVPPVGSAVVGQASASYQIGAQTFSALSNSISTLVLPVYSLSMTPMGTVPLPAYTLQGFEGDTVYTTFTVENTGNAPDSVITGSSIVAPSSIGVDRVFFFFDVNANGRFDAGEDDPSYFTPNMGESFVLSVGTVLLTGQGGGDSYIEVRAVSSNDVAVVERSVMRITTLPLLVADLHLGPYQNAEAMSGGDGSTDDLSAIALDYTAQEAVFRNDVTNLGTVIEVIELEVADTTNWPGGVTVAFEDTTGQLIPPSPARPSAALLGVIRPGETRTIDVRVTTGGLPFFDIASDSLDMRIRARSLVDPSVANETVDRILLPSSINPAAVLSLEQTFNRNIASVGDVVTLVVSVTNINDSVGVDSIVVTEHVQPVLNFLSSPDFVAAGQSLTWQVGSLQPGESRETVVKFIANSRVTQGETRVVGRGTGTATTGELVYTGQVINVLQIENDIFSEKGVVFGDVFVDDNANKKRDNDEDGIGGVAVYIESGEFALTDSLGKFAIPRTFSGFRVVRIDESTLPPDIKLVHDRQRDHRPLTERIVRMVPSGHATVSFALQRKPAVVTMVPRSIVCHELVTIRPHARLIYQIPAIPSSNFAPGTSYLKTDYLYNLNPIVSYLNRHAGWIVVVEGHTDSIPIHTAEFASNDELSLARAAAVRRYLTAQGIAQERVVVRGHADREPVATNATRQGRARNRRVEITFVPADMRNADSSSLQRVQTELADIASRPDSVDLSISWEISTNSADTFDVDLSLDLPDAITEPHVTATCGGVAIIPQDGVFLIKDFARSRGIQFEIRGQTAASDSAVIHDIRSALKLTTRGEMSDSAAIESPIEIRPYQNGDKAEPYALASWQEVDNSTEQEARAPGFDEIEALRQDNADADLGVGIIEPLDGTLFTRRDAISITVRVPLGSDIEIMSNGKAVPPEKVGQKVVRMSERLEEITYFGVSIVNGWNTIALLAKPVNGPAVEDTVSVGLAGRPRLLEPEQDRVIVPADGIATRTVRFRVLDQHGLSVIDGIVGTVVVGDTLLLSHDARPTMPGFQVMTRDGHFHLQIKNTLFTGKGRLVVALNDLDATCEVAFVPPDRRAFVSGIMQATLGSFDTSGEADPLGLEGFGDDLKLDGDARLIAQGTGKRGINLTARLDTENRYEDPLLKTINPDEQYSIYGDASEMYYAAPSQTGNYVALEKDESFVRFGDFRSPFTQGEFLTYRRSTTGLSTALVSGDDGVRGFVAETDFATHQDEIPGDGTSGFYYLSHSPVIENSITIVLQTRDRFQPELILDIQPLVQFRDFTLNYFDGALLFKEPIPVTTGDLNPVIIVANYEVRTDKEALYLYGFRGDVARFGRFNLGAEAVGRGRDGLNYALYGFDGSVTYRGFGLSGELARSDDDILGEGSAYKIKGLFSGRIAEGSAYYRNVARDFVNPSFAGGRTERYTKKAGFEGRLRFSPQLRLEADGYYHDLLRSDETESSVAAMGVLDKRSYSFSAGARTATESSMTIDKRQSALALFGFGLQRAGGLKFRTHYERNLTSDVVRQWPDRWTSLLSIPLRKGFDLVTNYEFRNAPDQPATHQFLSGLEMHLRPGSVAYTKYAMNHAGSDRRINAISGLKQKFKMTEKWTGLLNIEGQLSASGGENDEYLVFRTGANRRTPGSSLIEGQYEYRWQASSNRHVLNLIAIRELERGFSVLFRSPVSVAFPDQGMTAIHAESRLAGVYRPDVSLVRTLFLLKSFYDRFSPIDPLAINWRLVFSTDINIVPQYPHEFRVKFAAKRMEDYSFGISETTNSYLALGQYVYRFARVWDIDLWGRYLGQDGVGTNQLGAGAEVGRLFFSQIRVSAGYAVNGFEERDMSENDAWAKGFGFRVQYIISDWILNELGF